MTLCAIGSMMLLFAACQADDTTHLDETLDRLIREAAPSEGKNAFLLPNSSALSDIPADPNNPLTSEKVILGQLLYHETGLALNPTHSEGQGTYSCASCHFAQAGFQAGRFQGIGDGGFGIGLQGEGRMNMTFYMPNELDVQPIRTPSVLNTAYQELMLWNGQFGAGGANVGTEAQWTAGTPKATNHLGYQGLETQAIAGLEVHRLVIDLDFLEEAGYIPYFDDAFPDRDAEERYTRETAGLAIAAYERTVLANQAPFQQYLQGNRNAMNDMEKRGAILFFGEAACVDCHSGPNLADMNFYALGMSDLHECPEDIFQASADSEANLGRGGFTQVEADRYQFKTPQLYNLSDSPFYGHGSSLRSIRDVVAYKNEAVRENLAVPSDRLSPLFQPLHLSEDEIDDLTAFLTHSLYDPNLQRYVPESILSGQCFPNNDEQSREDLGCN